MTLPFDSRLNAGSLCIIMSPMLGFLVFAMIYYVSKEFYDLLYGSYILAVLGIYFCFYLNFHDNISGSHDSIVDNSMSIIGPCADLTMILSPCCLLIRTPCNVTFSLCCFSGVVNERKVIVTYPSLSACSSFLSIVLPYVLYERRLWVRSILRFSLRRLDLRSYN